MEQPGRGRRPVKEDFRSRRPGLSYVCMTGRCQEHSQSQRSPWGRSPTPVVFGLCCVDRVRIVCTGEARVSAEPPPMLAQWAPSPAKHDGAMSGHESLRGSGSPLDIG